MGFETPEEGYLAKILIPAGTRDVPIGKVRAFDSVSARRYHYDFVSVSTSISNLFETTEFDLSVVRVIRSFI